MAHSQEYVALRAWSACRRVPKLELLAACKMSSSYRRRENNGIDGIAPVGNTNASPRARSGWYCSLPASLLARQNAPLTASLKVGRCKVLLHDLTLVFFVGERPKGGELPKDNSSFTGTSASSRIMGFFPLLRGTGCKARLLSCTSLPLKSRLFSIWAHNQSFSCCRLSASSCNSFVCLACSSCFFYMSWRQWRN